MYDFDYYTPSISSSAAGSIVWTIVSVVLAIIGGIIAYVLFVNKDIKLENKFLIWLKEFLSFKKLLI